jgi:hypothetical protein
MDAGRRGFQYFPMREDQRLDVIGEDPTQAAAAGLWRDSDRWIGGLVWNEELTALSWTCATCHAAVEEEGGELLLGKPNVNLDVGSLYRLDNRENMLVDGWGAGRVDPTLDQTDNPSSISDLRPIRFQSHLHWTGTLKNSLAALAIRVETLFIVSSGETARPPRELAFAIAYWLWHLGSPVDVPADPSEGMEIFERECAGCHYADGLTAEPIPIGIVGTDPLLGSSPARGTGFYRVPSLRYAGDRELFFHDGSVSSLSSVLDPARRESGEGHLYGMSLDTSERIELLAFLEEL